MIAKQRDGEIQVESLPKHPFKIPEGVDDLTPPFNSPEWWDPEYDEEDEDDEYSDALECDAA